MDNDRLDITGFAQAFLQACDKAPTRTRAALVVPFWTCLLGLDVGFRSLSTLAVVGRGLSREILMAIAGIAAAVWLVATGIEVASCMLRIGRFADQPHPYKRLIAWWSVLTLMFALAMLIAITAAVALAHTANTLYEGLF